MSWESLGFGLRAHTLLYNPGQVPHLCEPAFHSATGTTCSSGGAERGFREIKCLHSACLLIGAH